MTEQPVVQINLPKESRPGSGASLVYVLYLASFVLGITLLIGVVIAYLNRGEAPDWVRAHYRFQIRTFWILLLFGAIGFVTAPFVIGFIVLVAAAVWLVIRCVKGLKLIGRGEPHPDPATWWI
jgi:uncharacterized membrane protein